jgi:hypothetical protein
MFLKRLTISRIEIAQDVQRHPVVGLHFYLAALLVKLCRSIAEHEAGAQQIVLLVDFPTFFSLLPQRGHQETSWHRCEPWIRNCLNETLNIVMQLQSVQKVASTASLKRHAHTIQSTLLQFHALQCTLEEPKGWNQDPIHINKHNECNLFWKSLKEFILSVQI